MMSMTSNPVLPYLRWARVSDRHAPGGGYWQARSNSGTEYAITKFREGYAVVGDIRALGVFASLQDAKAKAQRDMERRSTHAYANPLSLEGMKANPLGETILALVGTATLAVLGYFWYKSSVPPTVSNLSVTVQPGPMTVSANGALNVYAVLPPNGAWLSASNNAALVSGSIDPIYIQGPYPATPVALSWYVVPPPGTVGMAGPQTTTLTVNQ